MKCPNCSFENSEDTKNCKVCGFEFSTPVQGTKSRVIDKSEEEALDSAMRSLFGSSDNGADAEEEDPLDVALVSRLLQRKRPSAASPLSQAPSGAPAASREPEDKTSVKAQVPEQEDGEDDGSGKSRYNIAIIIIMLVIIVALMLLFKSTLSNSPWKYNSNNDNNQTVSSEPETTTTEETSEETEIVLGSEASLEPIHSFFRALPDFVNRGNLSILSLFTSSQEALDILTSFAVIGNLEKISSASLVNSEINPDNATYTVDMIMNRLVDGQQVQAPVTWDFRVIKDNAVWLIESFSVDSEALNLALTQTTAEPTTVAPTEQTTEKATEAITEAPTVTSTETKTEAPTEALQGFISSGSFSGGVKSSGQDIAYARYGNHDSFERIVFDIYEWLGGQPTNTVDIATEYSATISENGKTIRVQLNGAIDAFASKSSIDLKGSKNIQSITFDSPGNNETVVITITLATPSQFKVFNLKSPAKIVVDIAPLK